MATYVKQGDIFGRIGTGLGQGLAEQLPKEIERGRLASGLKEVAEQKDLSNIQRFAALAGVPGAVDRPQLLQTFGDLIRQDAIISNFNKTENKNVPPKRNPSSNMPKPGLSSATTTEGTEAKLNPYIPPSGPEQEYQARQLMAKEPQVYPTIDSARQAIANQVAGNIQQSNANIKKADLSEEVQNKAEQKLTDEIQTVGAKIPGTLLSRIQQEAVDAVKNKKLSLDEAKTYFGQEADAASRDFSNIRSWGNLGLITNSPKELIQSMSTLQKNSKERNYQKEAADSLIADNGLTPQFAYAQMYPVKDIPQLNQELKALPNIQPQREKSPQGPGLQSLDIANPKKDRSRQQTLDVAPALARAMGLEGSPLSIAYELEKKGYDPQAWKEYLNDNRDKYNFSTHQLDELEKPQPTFFGWLNDWWLSSFSGVK